MHIFELAVWRKQIVDTLICESQPIANVYGSKEDWIIMLQLTKISIPRVTINSKLDMSEWHECPRREY